MKHSILLASLIACSAFADPAPVVAPAGWAAPPECLPSTAGGAGSLLRHATRSDGAMVFAWVCPDGTSIAFGTEPAWKPNVSGSSSAIASELSRLKVLASYSTTPNFLRAEALALLVK